MSTATNGRAREHRVIHDLARHGWVTIMRAAGSKGPADLLTAHPIHGAALIQVGPAGKTLGPHDRARLVAAAHLIGALPLVARTHQGIGVHYQEVTLDVPATWPEFNPATGRQEVDHPTRT